VKRAFQFIIFDLVWLSAIIGREQFLWLTLALILLMAWSARAFYWQRRRYIATLVLVGVFAELILVLAGVIQFKGFSLFESALVPLWLIVLWVGFSAMVFTVFDWLQHRKVLSFLLGAIFGPVTYIAGERLGAAEFMVSSPMVITVYAVVWGLIMVLVSLLIRRANARPVINNSSGQVNG